MDSDPTTCPHCPSMETTSEIENCRNDLRQLEHNALEAVLHAFRGQGPLDVYKEVLLDHLKTALFISREDYIFKVDHVATNERLKQICDTLNPSYDQSEANWLLERQSVLPADFRLHMERLGRDVTDIFDPSNISEEDWRKMYRDDENKRKASLAKLLHLKKKPYVPELNANHVKIELLNNEPSTSNSIDANNSASTSNHSTNANQNNRVIKPNTSNGNAQNDLDNEEIESCEFSNIVNARYAQNSPSVSNKIPSSNSSETNDYSNDSSIKSSSNSRLSSRKSKFKSKKNETPKKKFFNLSLSLRVYKEYTEKTDPVPFNDFMEEFRSTNN